MCAVEEQRLDGGFDGGAVLAGGTVRRVTGRWTSSVQALLAHLAERGFEGAPRPLGTDEQGREVVSYLPGRSTGAARPWPAWVHSDEALLQVADWLRRYHAAVADFVPPEGAVWREGGQWRPGLVVAHNDAAPYNAVWDDRGLVGFVDWDMAGPVTVESDLAWMAFSWVPLHAPDVVAAEGFTAFGERRRRVRDLLDAYGSTLTVDELLDAVRQRLAFTMAGLHATAEAGDETYRRIIEAKADESLARALAAIDDV